jgi:hypothetical protein
MATRRGLHHVVGYRSKKGLRWVRCLDRVRDAAATAPVQGTGLGGAVRRTDVTDLFWRHRDGDGSPSLAQTGTRAAMVGVAAIAALLFLASRCLAAQPIAGGRYAGNWTVAGSPKSGGQRKGYIAFNVDDQGRAFLSDPRVAFEGSEIDGPCMESSWDLGGSERPNVSASGTIPGSVPNTTISNGTPVRIRANGTFFLAMTVRRGGTSGSLRFRGRFANHQVATGEFRVSITTAGRKCSKRGAFSVRFTGQRHFAVGSCTPPRTTTLADDGTSRVYRESYVYDPDVRHHDGGYGNGAVIYGCDRATRHRWVLAGDDTSNGLVDHYQCAEFGGPVAVAGTFMAILVQEICQPGSGSGQIRVVDLQTGTVHLDQAAPLSRDFGQNGVKSLVLAPTGSAAWIICEWQATRPCQVVDETAFGSNTLLDQGDQIDPQSLTLDGSTLSWRNNGETKTATLG